MTLDLRDSLTIPAAARQLNVSPIQVRAWIVTGAVLLKRRGKRLRLRASKAGQWRIRPADLEAFVSALTADALPDDQAETETAGTTTTTRPKPTTQTEAEYQRQLDRDLEWCRREGLLT